MHLCQPKRALCRASKQRTLKGKGRHEPQDWNPFQVDLRNHKRPNGTPMLPGAQRQTCERKRNPLEPSLKAAPNHQPESISGQRPHSCRLLGKLRARGTFSSNALAASGSHASGCKRCFAQISRFPWTKGPLHPQTTYNTAETTTHFGPGTIFMARFWVQAPLLAELKGKTPCRKNGAYVRHRRPGSLHQGKGGGRHSK